MSAKLVRVALAVEVLIGVVVFAEAQYGRDELLGQPSWVGEDVARVSKPLGLVGAPQRAVAQIKRGERNDIWRHAACPASR